MNSQHSYQNTAASHNYTKPLFALKSQIAAPQDQFLPEIDETSQTTAETSAPCSTPPSWFHWLLSLALGSFVQWLRHDAARHYEPGETFQERKHRSIAGYVRRWFYDPIDCTIQNYYLMALAVGIAVGLSIVVLKQLIEWGIDLVWETLPKWLVHQGVLGSLVPSYLYLPVVVTAGCVGCGLSFEKYKTDMPDQNSLLEDLDQKGRISSKRLWPLLYLSTIVMWCGLPLGPELPLLLIFAMFGSDVSETLGLDKNQSRLVLYFSMAAAIGAFFHFPIGAFWFVVEVPHRMGVFHRMGRLHAQLVGPCAAASLTATVVHCYLTGTPVERMFDLPGIPEDLSCAIPVVVLLAAYLGNCFGKLYSASIMKLKTTVQGIPDFLFPGSATTVMDQSALIFEDQDSEEEYFSFDFGRRNREATARAKLLAHGVTCLVVGLIISAVYLVFPHCFSWGEAQLQNMFDNGSTELPFFGDGSPFLSPFAMCMPTEDGLGGWCLTAIPVAKTLIIGLVLGTGIRCGHFWGPIYGAAAIGQLVLHLFDSLLGVTMPYAGLFLICVMASAHVVIFRSPLGISYLLMQSAGYDIIASAAVLTAALISLSMSRDAVFYKAQKDHVPIYDLDSDSTTTCKKCTPTKCIAIGKKQKMSPPPKLSPPPISGYTEILH